MVPSEMLAQDSLCKSEKISAYKRKTKRKKKSSPEIYLALPGTPKASEKVALVDLPVGVS